jgi:hypothetical protein
MFMRVNSKCAHHVRPPLRGLLPREPVWLASLTLPETLDAVRDRRPFVALVRELCDGERERFWCASVRWRRA